MHQYCDQDVSAFLDSGIELNVNDLVCSQNMHELNKINRAQKIFDEIKKDYAYYLYVDIRRDDGRWMDLKYGAPGRRITFKTNVFFLAKPASGDLNVIDRMAKDNFGRRCMLVGDLMPERLCKTIGWFC